jgi:rare lipoprotein A
MIVKYIKSTLCVFVFTFLFFGCSSSKSTIPSKNTSSKSFKKNVEASYYADKFNGRKTASGEIFENNKMTCAHRTLAFGTKVKVINIANNQSVIVVVNDRGPQKTTREIDLSKSAFMKITENKNNGILKVNIETVK